MIACSDGPSIGGACPSCALSGDVTAWAADLQRREAALLKALSAWKLLEAGEAILVEREHDVNVKHKQCMDAYEKVKTKTAALKQR